MCILGFFRRDNFEVQIDKTIHLLVLDNKWHELFDGKKPIRVQSIERKLNGLLKEQGSLNTQLKEYVQLKKKMMDEIVSHMGSANDGSDPSALKTMERNRKYIEQINAKMDKIEERLTTLPEKISEANRELVTATMSQFYHTMLEDKQEAKKLDEKVKTLKEEIKETIIRRDEKNEEYQKLYGYMHDVVGSDVISQYDAYYIKDSEREQDD